MARVFDKYDLIALPVVDGEKHLVGIITVDDVLDVMKKETTEDMEIMAAISARICFPDSVVVSQFADGVKIPG